ncbi:DNA segregation ATPase FtsK/SpoIIIE, S-DNA-T family [Parafrankia irregularis]|uniref:DNA segregation ATPase FtsK/SpoIIIE, S-DNA-T family n=1 Tax=Parafrankia irregularis TaxID=795642 RepID=A0A0S4R247_9ACTN|nr:MULTISPECIES: FtsK/SpoIIIE domain-containing protein [Parafrankia]MBE3204373.1 cell division protein FtsK [Parafrankia sp. CH37]CUU61096.1 DNA segregation ATPase FtsK/SpoIIIE, S-DNA-T family [Parafrankia irregularis]
MTSSHLRFLLADADPARRVLVSRRVPLAVSSDDTIGQTLWALAGWAVRAGLSGALRLVLRFPRTMFAVLSALLLVDRVGWVLPLLLACLLALSALVWRLAHPGSYRLWLGLRLRSWWLRWTRYSPRWGRLMRAHALTVKPTEEVEAWPRILRVRSTGAADSLLLRLRDGQAPEDLEAKVIPLAHALGSEDVRVRTVAPGRLWLDIRRRDLLAATIPALPVPAAPDLSRLEIGRCDDGSPWLLRLLGTHVLVAGATDAGKGSVLQSILRALAPLIASGVVEVWAIDPKGGMELYPVRSLFTRYADESTKEMADLLTDFARVTRERSTALKGHGRKFTPSVATPFRLGIVDEFAFLSAYQPDHTLAREVDSAVQIICSQGRAPGSALLVAVQDPSKEVVPYRQLFPTRIALRLDEPTQVGMVLGPGAWERGARCEEIPTWAHGTGYVKLDGRREPVRVRAAYPDDDDVAALAAGYPAPLAASRSLPVASSVAATRPLADLSSAIDGAFTSDTPLGDGAYLGDDELDAAWAEFSRDFQRRNQTSNSDL